MNRYSRNMSTLSITENETLKNYKVCVIGCGGIGGYVIEMLGRIGIGNITAVDGDKFDESNLNRQLYSDEDSISLSKAYKAKERMAKVNSLVTVNPVDKNITEENAEEILKGHNIVIDALDNIKTRLFLEDECEKLNIPLVSGAIGGWYVQLTTIFPGDRTLHKIFRKDTEPGIEKKLGNPSFTPALAASIQVSEAIKVLIGRGEPLSKKILFIDLLSNEYDIIEI